MKQYIPEQMTAISRYRNYLPTLPKDVQKEVHARMKELIEEES